MFDGAKKNQANANSGSLSDIQSLDAAQRNKGVSASQIQPIEGAQRFGTSDASDSVEVVEYIDADVSSGLISYWQLEEESGVRVDSITATGNDLTDNNTVTSTTGQVQNGALFVAANTEYLSIADNASLSWGDDDRTIAFWVKFTTVDNGTDDFILGKWDANNAREWRIYRRSGTDDLSWQVGDGASSSVAVLSAAPVVAGTWYFIVMGHDKTANTIFLSVNNGAMQTTAHATGFGDNTNDFKMGDSDTLAPLNGILDEVGIWDRVLDSDEITHLYNGGNGRTWQETSSNAGESMGLLLTLTYA
jgi:hypothetical protein